MYILLCYQIHTRNEIGKLWLAWDDNINQIVDLFHHCYMIVLSSVGKFPFFISSVEADVFLSSIHLIRFNNNGS